MKEKIKLSAESESGISETFARYTEKEFEGLELKFHFRIAIHLYPTGDTITENGEAEGFADALFFEACIYDMREMVFYRAKSRDGIKFENGFSPEVRIFKDGSTMIIVDEPCRVVCWQRMEVSKI